MKLLQLFEQTTTYKGKKLAKWSKIQVDHFIDYMVKKYNIPYKIIIINKPSTKRLFGYVDIVALEKENVAKITLDLAEGSITMKSRIAHELQHVIQFKNKKLKTSDDYQHIMWNNKNHISVKDYNKLTWDTYKKLPWEADAIKKAKTIVADYKKDLDVNDLKGLDVNLDYIIDNDLL